MGGSIFVRVGYLTYVCCRGHRSDVALIESLILELNYAVETRRGDRKVVTIGLATTISPRIETR